MRRRDGPQYHVRPREGWLNDPNGLIVYGGAYHVFYQHVEKGCDWDWGLVWGHAVSHDLAHWHHFPPALVPTRGSADSDGCWSGCCALDGDGRPVLLYTGVRLHSTPVAQDAAPAATEGCGIEVGRLPANDDGAGPLWTETQCLATLAAPEYPGASAFHCAATDDLLLVCWTKGAAPLLPTPPAELQLLGWRDPFLYARPRERVLPFAGPWGQWAAGGVEDAAEAGSERSYSGDGSEAGEETFRLVVGCGISGIGGALLAYSSNSLTSGWQYNGVMCSAADVALSAGVELGAVWECPLLAPLPGGGSAWLLAVSPYPCVPPNSPSNPVLAWVGHMEEGWRFDLTGAHGPFRMDLGDCLYAPSVCRDTMGDRLLLWGWQEERRRPGSVATYSGCLTLPRVLTWHSPGPEGRLPLAQAPAPELAALRRGAGWRAKGLEVHPGRPVAIGGEEASIEGVQLEVRLTLRRGSAASAGLRLASSLAGERGDATITYSWETHSLTVSWSPPGAPGEGAGASRGSSQAAPFEGPPPNTAPSWAAGAVPMPLDLALAELQAALPAPPSAAAVEPGDAAPPPVGGRLAGKPCDSISLTVFVDESSLEVYTGDGQVLTTRVYRGQPARGCSASIVATGGVAVVERARAWELDSAWGEEEEESAEEFWEESEEED
eukprot:scaffold16.g132.t1